MSHRSVNRFNQREVARALRAARLAGERPERVEIDPVTGRITVIIAQAHGGLRRRGPMSGTTQRGHRESKSQTRQRETTMSKLH